MSIRLIQTAPGEIRAFVLEQGATTLGRDGDNNIQLVFGSVSRHHVKLTVTGDSCLLEDAGSSNGTLVNNKTATGVDLKDGDIIAVGECVFRFEHVPDSEAGRAEFVPRVFSDRAHYATVKMKTVPIRPSVFQKAKQAVAPKCGQKWWSSFFRKKQP